MIAAQDDLEKRLHEIYAQQLLHYGRAREIVRQ